MGFLRGEIDLYGLLAGTRIGQGYIPFPISLDMMFYASCCFKTSVLLVLSTVGLLVRLP